jgi:hypothetical protein
VDRARLQQQLTMPRRSSIPFARWSALLALALGLSACGGGDSALDNPPQVANPPVADNNAGRLSFVYFQRCIQPVLNTPLRVVINGVPSINTCASAGCHDNASGTGGALRLVGSALPADLTLTPAQIRNTEMYRNYFSSAGEVAIGQPLQSRLLNKPLVRNVLHGGGLIFESPDDPAARLIRYWIERPMPQGQDEFSPAAAALFTPADLNTGACNTQ